MSKITSKLSEEDWEYMHDLSKDVKFHRSNPLQNHLHISKDHSREANYVMVPQFSFFFYFFY